MPTAFLRSKVDERATLTDVVEGIYQRCTDATRDPDQAERKQLDELSARITELDGTIAQLRTAEDANQRFLGTAGAVEDAAERIERRRTDKQPQSEQRAVSAGQAFIDSDQFKNYRGRGTMEPVEFQDFLGIEQRMAVIAGPITEASLLIPPSRWDGPAGPQQRTPFLSAIGREQVSTNSVSYITWGPATGAAVVAETDTKPEAALTPTETPATLQTYAFWKAITRQALEDYPRIRSIVETKLRQGLAQTLESAAVAVLAGVAAPDAETNLEGIRLSMAELQGRGYTPTAIAANPTDAAYLDLAVMNGTLGGPSSPGSFWGLRVLPVPGIAQGKAYVGDLQNAVTWFDRGSASVYMSDSHADYFIRNLFVILAEERSAFALTEPAAIEAVTIVLPTPPAGAAAESVRSSKS
jgi:HK97 family phage major capsid protein